ncbi:MULTISPECIES: PTS sugar transporter subunit IIA [Lactobacillus]|uniref:PTS sugar transporter subunit IIA n=1 Tax=Lactobacillus TaxID=1578 RepID=UPI001C696A29|nr:MULTISPECIES: hypothetical protein [Lactobacillus]MCX8720441.1 hypothetical protein [Lactobacillus sp. B4010]MCX8723455.1 hypothetical protein [Lactobacillus sp. B4005]MCX8731536.1 hypothetical protein [Lactobacillus sp. B4015]MCX8733757.1 hypothetical protein [Lactobacillus sp. B4012]QYN57271.1 hypothetical protein GYM69_09120 [Lactobacillus panisapium]
MSQFIIATHSYLANGYQSSLKFFDSSVNNVQFINAYVDEQTNFTDELSQMLDQMPNEQVVILTDMPGGSVNREAVNLIKKYHCQVISGINLALVLELVLNADQTLSDETIRLAVSQAQKQLVYVNDLLKEDDLE